ncbi:MAG: hypothetical protein ACFFCZ_25625 [Promethearchaeota archaeon]
MVLGTCQSCGRSISSSSYKLCGKCATEQNVCMMCLGPLDQKGETRCSKCKGKAILH